MHYRLATTAGRWDDGREERLLLSFLLAAVIVALGLSLVRLPALPPFAPVLELMVRIVQPEASRPSEAGTSESPAEPAASDPARGRTEPGPLVQPPLPAAPREALDLDALRQNAVREYLDRTDEQPWAFDPRVDELRREGRLRYRPPTIERPGPIWENAEQDQLGRTILRDGDCWRVIDDPNVVSRAQFEEFGQYLTTCTFQPRGARELPWVETIREQYDYLGADGTTEIHPAGEIPHGETPDGKMPEPSRD